MFNDLKTMSHNFWADNSGLALTEYLLVLGIVTAGILGAILIFGENLTTAWLNWANWVGTRGPSVS